MSKVTIALLIILVLIVLAVTVTQIANYRFNQSVNNEVKELFSNVDNKNDIIQKADIEALPPCVQKWMEYSQIVGKERISSVRLRQSALMRTTEESKWMPTEAEQYFATDEPGFIWKAKISAAPLFHIAGRDKYANGRGNMLIKVMSLVAVADAQGKEIDQGTLLRFLAETVWFPAAALSDYITWEEIDANSAQATMSYGGITASGVFNFNDKGEVVDFTAERYMEKNGQYSLETWLVSMQGYKEFNGIRIPDKGEVIWKLKTGDFSWYQFEIDEIEYNKPVVY